MHHARGQLHPFIAFTHAHITLRSNLLRTSLHVPDSARTCDVLPLATFASSLCPTLVMPCDSSVMYYVPYRHPYDMYHWGAYLISVLPYFRISVLPYFRIFHIIAPMVLRVIRAPCLHPSFFRYEVYSHIMRTIDRMC